MEDATDGTVKQSEQSEQPTEDTGEEKPRVISPERAERFCWTKGQIKFLDPDKVKIKRP